MAKAKTDLPKDHEKASFDPADFLPDDDEQTSLDDLDFGNEYAGDEDDDEAPETEAPETEEPEEEGEEEEEAEAEAEEPEPEAPETEEPEDDEDPETEEAEKPRGKKQHMIPKGRLDHQIAKTRQLEQEIERLRQDSVKAQKEAAERAKVPDADIQSWLREASQKAIDGEIDDAAALQKKAFDAMASNRGEAAVGQAPMDPDELVAQIEERVELKHVVKQVFTDYPMLNPEAEGFDQDLNSEVLEYQDFYISKGYTPSVAVERAVLLLAKTHDLQPVGYEAPVQKAKRPERSVDVPVQKKLKAAGQQPPEPSGRRGNKAAPEDTVDIHSLDDEGWMALPESVRAQLRGDA